MKEVDKIFDLVGLENVAEGGHRSAAVLDLMLDFFFAQALADGAEVRASFPAAAVWPMAMLASLFMKECGSGVFRIAGVGVNDRRGLSKAGCQGYDDGRDTEGSTDSR